jgi:integrase/recombinase XerD
LTMRWSGLAIRDASCLRRDALGADNRLKTYRQKTGEFVYIKLRSDVADILRAEGERNIHPDYFFWDKSKRNGESQAKWVEGLLRDVYDAAGIAPRGAHRLRDTFSVEFLSNGGLMQDLSKLLGHSTIQTTEKHYSPWDKSRQRHLDAAMDANLAAQGYVEPPAATVQ